jgi:hypothetical protein
VHAPVVETEGFGDAIALVVAASNVVGVHITLLDVYPEGPKRL